MSDGRERLNPPGDWSCGSGGIGRKVTARPVGDRLVLEVESKFKMVSMAAHRGNVRELRDYLNRWLEFAAQEHGRS